jgi:uncharacterized protein YhhL (DUF1145 family)
MAAKTVVGIVWIYCALAFLAPVPLAGAARIVFGLLVVTHVVECIVFLPRMRAAGGSLAHHVVQVMLFGVFHARTLPETGAA